LVFADEAAAHAAVAPLESVVIEGVGPMFGRFRVEGRTVTFAIANVVDNPDEKPEVSIPVHFRALGAATDTTVTPADLGFILRSRVGGDNTAYHIPEGIMVAYGAGVTHDPSRKEVDVLDVAPSLLANVLGVEPAATMKGLPTLFG
jgi:hypothetical protein